jgi:hypothetical protein
VKKFHLPYTTFAKITGNIIESAAFHDLSGKSMLVLIRFYQKVRWKRIGNISKNKHLQMTNNGQLIFTYAEASELGISPQSFSRALVELIEEKGFIDISELGHWYQKKSTMYGISER